MLLAAAESDPQLRSRVELILNVPQGYVSGEFSPVASLDDHFGPPAVVDAVQARDLPMN